MKITQYDQQKENDMKTIITALSLVALSGCATYGTIDDGAVIGGVMGGLLGNTIGGGNGRVAATAAGAVIGSQVLSNRNRFPTQSRGIPPAAPYPYNYPTGNPIYERAAPCDGEVYIDGNYNPPAAQARCRGRMERERVQQHEYERESYERGRRGQ